MLKLEGSFWVVDGFEVSSMKWHEGICSQVGAGYQLLLFLFATAQILHLDYLLPVTLTFPAFFFFTVIFPTISSNWGNSGNNSSICGQFKHVHHPPFAPSKCATMGKIKFLLCDLLSSKSLCPVTAPVSAMCIHKTHCFSSLHLSTTFPFLFRLVLNLNYYSPAVSLGCIHPSGFKFFFQTAGWFHSPYLRWNLRAVRRLEQ